MASDFPAITANTYLWYEVSRMFTGIQLNHVIDW